MSYSFKIGQNRPLLFPLEKYIHYRTLSKASHLRNLRLLSCNIQSQIYTEVLYAWLVPRTRQDPRCILSVTACSQHSKCLWLNVMNRSLLSLLEVLVQYSYLLSLLSARNKSPTHCAWWILYNAHCAFWVALQCSLCLMSGFTMLTVPAGWLSKAHSAQWVRAHRNTGAATEHRTGKDELGGRGGGWHAWLPMVLPVAWWGGGETGGGEGGALHKYPAHISPAYVFLMQAHSRFHLHLLVTYFRRYEQWYTSRSHQSISIAKNCNVHKKYIMRTQCTPAQLWMRFSRKVDDI